MKALTIWPEWAPAFRLGKRIENRSWKPWFRTRERTVIALHAGRQLGGGVLTRYDALTAVTATVWVARGIRLDQLDLQAEAKRLAGHVFAVANVAEILERSRDPWFCGPIGWRLDHFVWLDEPVPCSGAQGLWPLPGAVYERILPQIQETTPC